MTEPTPTPRTDAQWEEGGSLHPCEGAISVDFARQLERELEQAQAGVRHMNLCRELLKVPENEVLLDAIEELVNELSQAKADIIE